MARSLPAFVAIGKIVKPHGIKGYVKVLPLTEHPARFEDLQQIQVELPSRNTFTLNVSEVGVRGDVIFLKLEGIDSRDDALTLSGAFLNIPREELLPLDDDEYYHFELIGMSVKTEAGEMLGKVASVIDNSANDVIVVRNNDREHLIPMIKDILVKMDFENDEIVIKPIPGLLS